MSERQTDFEELVTGPPAAAAFKPDGDPTPAAAGFARKYGVEVAALERQRTPKGEYLAYRVRQRGKATVDVLADVLARTPARHDVPEIRCGGTRIWRMERASSRSGARSAGSSCCTAAASSRS